MGLSREMSGINCQAKGFEVQVKRKTWDIIEHMSYYNKRNSITKGYLLVSGEFLENIFSSLRRSLQGFYNPRQPILAIFSVYISEDIFQEVSALSYLLIVMCSST